MSDVRREGLVFVPGSSWDYSNLETVTMLRGFAGDTSTQKPIMIHAARKKTQEMGPRLVFRLGVLILCDLRGFATHLPLGHSVMYGWFAAAIYVCVGPRC